MPVGPIVVSILYFCLCIATYCFVQFSVHNNIIILPLSLRKLSKYSYILDMDSHSV